MPERPEDRLLEESTNRWMLWGLVLMGLMVAIFPVYRWYEPAARDDARETHLASLAEQGASIYSFNCGACHGADGEGGIGPALNSEQFLTSANDEQITALIAVGVPGSQMNAYSIDFGGPLTSEQIKAVTTYLRSLEETAPDVPDWLNPLASRQPSSATAPPTTAPPATTVAPPDSGATTTASPTTTAAGQPDTEALALGREVYEVTAGGAGCAICHGSDAGGGSGGPAVAGATKSAISAALGGGVASMSFIELTTEELDAVYEYLQTLSSADASTDDDDEG